MSAKNLLSKLDDFLASLTLETIGDIMAADQPEAGPVRDFAMTRRAQTVKDGDAEAASDYAGQLGV